MKGVRITKNLLSNFCGPFHTASLAFRRLVVSTSTDPAGLGFRAQIKTEVCIGLICGWFTGKITVNGLQ